MQRINIQQATTVPEGDGVEVKRLMPVANLRNFDPFVLWDHFDISGGGFPDHPHRGFEAITYMFAGGMQHADNLGNKGTIHAGGAQRFTAGKGIVHSEMPEGRASGIQLWINLPQRLKGIEPAYQQVEKDEVSEVAMDGGWLRIIVGQGGAITLQTKVEYFELFLQSGSTWERMVEKDWRGFVYVVEGCLSLDGSSIPAGSAAYIDEMNVVAIHAVEDTRLMWCFGQPHGEPIYQHGSFVD